MPKMQAKWPKIVIKQKNAPDENKIRLNFTFFLSYLFKNQNPFRAKLLCFHRYLSLSVRTYCHTPSGILFLCCCILLVSEDNSSPINGSKLVHLPIQTLLLSLLFALCCKIIALLYATFNFGILYLRIKTGSKFNIIPTIATGSPILNA